MLKHYKEDRGSLSYLEFDNLNFQPKRVYYVSNVPSGEIRGKHGHKKDKQYLICVKGKVGVRMVFNDKKSGAYTETYKILNEGDSCLLDTWVWGEQKYLTEDTILLVLCSEKYDQDEYIHDINEILNYKKD